jgi:multicomponent K+:H+ antiporter subunit A
LGSALVVPLEWGSRPRVPVTVDFVLLWLVGGAAAIGAAWQAKFHRLFALDACWASSASWCASPSPGSRRPTWRSRRLAVEAVTTIFFLLGLRWLPKRIPEQEPALFTRPRAGGAAATWCIAAPRCGPGGALSYAMLTRTGTQSISPFFLENALPRAAARNVVNVMLVDFRAFDTLGEITVLAAVGLTVYALLRRFRPPREVTVLPPQQRLLPPGRATDLVRPEDVDGGRGSRAGYLLVPAVLVRLLLPISLVVALAPVAARAQPSRRRLRRRPHRARHRLHRAVHGGRHAMGGGPDGRSIRRPGSHGACWAQSSPASARWPSATRLLTTHTAHVSLPVMGELHLPSAALFDPACSRSCWARRCCC